MGCCCCCLEEVVGLLRTECPTGTTVVDLTSSPYAFDPKDFEFMVGTSTTLCFVGDDEFHTFTIQELGININIIPKEIVVVDVTPDQTGAFKLFCIPHEALGMTGEVRVS